MSRAAAFALVALLMLGACAEQIAESRVRSALTDAGVSDRTAECMAGRMVDRLTVPQLRRLEELKHSSEGTREDSVADYLQRVRRVGDPEVLAVTTSSAALCSTGLAR